MAIKYISFVDPITGSPRIGDYDESSDIIKPLLFLSGTPVSSLYQAIEAGENRIRADGDALPYSKVKVLAPLTGRDILCVGKNYSEHAKEFNSSGYDSSDKVDIPTHPVIFTKRSTSVIAHGEEILPHADFTKTADYEGEIGVIIGKAGYRISENEAMDYVWGYTIINDMTARERQRDHKQFYIGKSPDTFCPMGPIAVAAKDLPEVLRVQTHVNGVLEQNATTKDLIFSIPFLIKTISEGQTLQPGDVLATGTPAGVGIGKKPPVFLNPGDSITVSITGLGSLTNQIASLETPNYTAKRLENESCIPVTNLSKSNGIGLAAINNKPLYYQNLGTKGDSPIVFIHGLGGTSVCWGPLISTLSLATTHSLHLFDLEGHGLSPTSPLSALSISSFASDVKGIFEHANISSGATIMAHSMGCLIALTFAIENPSLVKKLILLGPPESPFTEEVSQGIQGFAKLARTKGMPGVVDALVAYGTSEYTSLKNPLAVAALRLSLMGQDPEGYAKACSALAGATQALDLGRIEAETLIITGDRDLMSPPQLCKKYAKDLKAKEPVVLENVGHWHLFEDVGGVSEAVKVFLGLD